MPLQTALQHLGVAKETTWGTGVAPVLYLPFESAKPDEEIGMIVDSARRGNLTKDYNVLRTSKKSMFEVEAPLFTGPVGYFLLGLMGGLATTGAGPYVHTFTVGTTARSLTLQHYDGVQENRFAGCVVDELTFKSDAENLVTFSAKLQGKFGASTTTTVPTAPSYPPLVGPFAALTIGGVANANLFGWEVNLKRNNKLLFGSNNSQDPNRVVQGTIEATGKLTFDVENLTEYNYLAAGAAILPVITLNGTATSSMVITFTAAHVEKATKDFGDEAMRVDLEFRGVYNATDAGPCKIVLTNSIATY